MEIKYGDKKIEVFKLKNLIYLRYEITKISLVDLKRAYNSFFKIVKINKNLTMTKLNNKIKIGCLEDDEKNFLEVIKKIENYY